ncbi:MAG: patatin-like phospholipase family protein [Ktedonobacterales bacterium]
MQLRDIQQGLVKWFRRRPDAYASSQPEATNTTTTSPHTAFILLGGGSRGAAQAGALTVLLDNGITPDVIIGMSAGSWNGAYLALDPTPERAFQLEGNWVSTTSHEIMGPNRWSLALNAVASRASLYGSAGMQRVAERYLADTTFEELHVPLRIVAANLISGEPKIFSSGPLLPAVLASSAVPGIFPPIISEQEVLVDGTLAEWTGCTTALEMGATRIFLVSCGGVFRTAPQLRTFRHILERSMELHNRASFAQTVFALRGAGAEVIPIFPEMTAGNMLDFDHAPELVASGRLAARQALRDWEQQKAGNSVPVPAQIPVTQHIEASILGVAPSY